MKNAPRREFRTPSANATSTCESGASSSGASHWRYTESAAPSNRDRPWRARSELRGGPKNDTLQNDLKNYHSKRNRQRSNFSFKFMESLLEEPLEEVIQKLIGDDHFFNYIGTKLPPDNIVMIVKLLSRFCDCNFTNLRIKMLQKSLSSGFVINLQSYVSTLVVQSAKDKQFNSLYWNDTDSFWSNFLKFCHVSLRVIPHFFVDNVLHLVRIVLINIPNIEKQHQVHISDKIKDNFESLVARAEEIITVSSCQNRASQRTEMIDNNEEKPPDDFRDMSIFPTTVELVSTEKPFVRKNVVVGPYKSVDHYLDIQFRLLREDFVGPLKLGIQCHISGEDQHDIQDIKIHPKVQFMKPVTVTGDYCVLLKFHFGGELDNLKFEDSRRYMYGSLLCFTKDNFNSIVFGRIVDNNKVYLKNGKLVIGFNKPEDIVYNADYVMVEYNIYFEPYYHVLKVLKQIREEDFPMKNYIVDVDKTVMNPPYIHSMIQYRKRSGLNQSQKNAYIAALTRKFSIIQGPPGTGKTYVGLKVARTLLENSDVWFRNSPMLVICFTNHALDQFLEGLIGTTQHIMRIGGQSKNEKLEPFNLRNYAHENNPSVLGAKELMYRSLANIRNITYELNHIASYDCILSVERFADVIPNFHQSWLAEATDKDFLRWLLKDYLTEIEDHYFQENNEELSTNWLLENFNMENSELVDEEHGVDEIDELDELWADMVSESHILALHLIELDNTILSITRRLKRLESKIQEDNKYLFKYVTLRIRHDRLKAIYDFVQIKLATAPRENTEVRLHIDAEKSEYIPYNERWNLYFYWLNLYKEKLVERYENANLHYREKYEIYNELKDMRDVAIMKTMKVIGMTTTSAARLHSSLQLLRSPIVIVEEAAEVLEAHIIAALTKRCKQLILIGDHKQLRPNTASYEIEKYYKLGISLFERMVMNEVQCFTLDIQHRMRPEISSLIKPAIYPNLKDHESVLDRPLIGGVEKCLYFIDHQVPEEPNAGNSRKNIHEAKFLVQLARYLILNGYESHEITILAAYLGQMFEIQKLQRKIDLLEGVRVAVLDNYQGEESDIILLSLVRNNEDTIGFLSIENRVCVALSRARNGLYIMGNMSLLCNKSKLWFKIKETLLAQEAIGSALSLKCQNHNKITMVSTADHFCLVSDGGCNQICNSSLPYCLHKCKKRCHPTDHEYYFCTEKCNLMICDFSPLHVCRKMCGEECGLCDYPKNEILNCGHEAVMECHTYPEDYQCQIQVEVTLPCGHDAVKPCYIESKLYECKIPCDARLDCGHSCLWNCHVFNDPDHVKYECPKSCDKFKVGCTNLKDDEHKCSKRCYEECEPCKEIVKKPRTVCPHYFDVACNENVDKIVCSKPCKKKLNCGHKCANKCKEICGTCEKKVAKEIPGCNHIVKLPCNVEADKIYCNKKCPRVMVCGHICGRRCKDNCDPYNCEEMVTVAILARCGHIIKEVPCFVKTLYDKKGESSINALESYCTEPCTAILDCSPKNKHLCSGSCGSCYQGRIHKRCAEKCSQISFCNHQCDGFCWETCKPCSKKCSYKCKHNVCKNRCGDLCSKCKEQCNRKCEHQRCIKKCGEICNIPPCEEACDKTLICGHPCIGFCSEPCPPLCRICNKDEVEEFFFGTEDEEEARFILLNDCGHILESSGMKQWLDQNPKKIGFKACPKCKTNIFTTERYSDYLKKSVEHISNAKITEMGTQKKIDEKRVELASKIQDLSFPVRMSTQMGLQKLLLKKQNILLDHLQVKELRRTQSYNVVGLNAIEIRYQLMDQVFNIMKTSDLDDMSASLAPHVENQVDLILGSLLREVNDITTNEIEDIQREINRLHRMIQILPLLSRLEYQETEMVAKIMRVNEKINGLSKFDKVLDNCVKQDLSDLRQKLSLLDITDLEKPVIVKAMGFLEGYWYMCPNGHSYVTEYGTAIQTSKCHLCVALIEGENERLLETNRVATIMDGATQSALSECQNMNNHDF